MNPSSKLSLQQLAEKLGFAKSTVSMALRNDMRVAAETRSIIQEAAVKLGYVADADLACMMAQIQVRKKKSYQANLAIFPITTTTVSRRQLEGCRNRAEELGYKVDLIEDYATCSNPVKLMEARGIRGAIFIGWPWREFPFAYPGLKRVCNSFPCAVVAARPQDPPMNSVMSDALTSMRLAVTSLMQLGYKRPAAFINPYLDNLLDQSYTGAFLTMQRNLTRPDRLAPVFITEDKKRAIEYVRKHKPDCILTHDSYLLEVLKTCGCRVPEDIGYAHLDLHHEHRKLGVSGIDQNHHLLGEAAVDMVVAQIHRSEFGAPAIQKCVLIEGRWENGKTTRMQG